MSKSSTIGDIVSFQHRSVPYYNHLQEQTKTTSPFSICSCSDVSSFILRAVPLVFMLDLALQHKICSSVSATSVTGLTQCSSFKRCSPPLLCRPFPISEFISQLCTRPILYCIYVVSRLTLTNSHSLLIYCQPLPFLYRTFTPTRGHTA